MNLFSRLTTILTVLMLCHSFGGTAQTVPGPAIESPNMTALDKFQTIPVNLFTGTPQISIPLHTLKYGKIEVPINLRYHPAAVKPSPHPGWVGLGWDLESIGSITRTMHNMNDEYDGPTPDEAYYPLPNYNPPTSELDGADIAQLSTWATTSDLGNDYTMDKYPIMPDAEADEFSFSVMGHTGKFYYQGSTLGWQVVSDENIKVQLNPAPNDFISFQTIQTLIQQYNSEANNPHLNNGVDDSRAFSGFTLTVPDGTKYVFGGVNAIEFYNPFTPDPTINAPEFYASTWLLTQIIDADGNTVNFQYARTYPTCDLFIGASGFSIQTEPTAGSTFTAPTTPGSFSSSTGTGTNQLSGYMYWPMYLTQISSPNETIAFNAGVATCPRYTVTQFGSLVGGSASGEFATEVLNNNSYSNLQWMQLNNIVITNSQNGQSGTYRQYQFNYEVTNAANQRLTLNSLTEQDNTGATVEQYSFGYNNIANLPLLFNGDNCDHWGYYNNKSVDGINMSQAFTQRQTDNTVVTTGLLTKIVYPTGGYTTLSWEAHDYSQVVSATNHASLVAAASTPAYAGGSRIIGIANYLADNTLATQKTYLYKRGYSNGVSTANLTSSGILNGIPAYVFNCLGRLSAAQGYWTWLHLESLNPMGVYSYNGSDSYIGYDEVDEIEGDGSYTKHFFTSYGTDLNNVSHADQPIPGSIGWAAGDNYFPYISLDGERGKPVAVYSYTPGNVLVKKEITTYRSDAARFNTYIRTVRNTGNYQDVDMVEDALTFAAAIPVYSYDYYPMASTVTTYDQQGNNPLVESHSYTYNVNNQVATQTDVDSKGESVVTTYQYPADMTSDATCVAMAAAHILSPVIQKTSVNTTRTSEPIISIHTTYYSPSTGIYAPQSVQVQVGSNPVETRQQFYQYDKYGNVVELSKTSDTHEVYLWGYNGQYPVAKVTGSTYNTVMGYITQAQLDNAGGSTDLQMRTALNAIRAGIPTALVSTYTCSPVTGITSETDPRGQTTYYQYDTYQRLHAILDQDQNVLKTYNYNYAQ